MKRHTLLTPYRALVALAASLHGHGSAGQAMMGSMSSSDRPCPFAPASGRLPGDSQEDTHR